MLGVWWLGGQVRVHPPPGHQYSTALHNTDPGQVNVTPTTTTAVMFPALLYTTAELSAAFL